MFGFALLASCSPCHDDWLNEWSSTPPVSSTMHALNAPPAAAELAGAAGVDAAGAELAGAAGVDAAGAEVRRRRARGRRSWCAAGRSTGRLLAARTGRKHDRYGSRGRNDLIGLLHNASAIAWQVKCWVDNSWVGRRARSRSDRGSAHISGAERR